MNIVKNTSVEGIRGLACLLVIASHLSLILLPYLHGENPALIKGSFDALIYSYPVGFLYSGTSAVYIFFALSGFILTYACLTKDNVLNSCINMALKRYIRLMLPVLASVIICFIILSFFENKTDGLPWIKSYGVGAKLDFGSAIYNGVFGAIFLGDNIYNWVTWTMKVEFYGSLLVFASLPFINSLSYKGLIAAIIAFLFMLCMPGKEGYGYSAFFFGVAIFYMKDIRHGVSSLVLFMSGLYLAGYHPRQPSYHLLSSMITFDMPGGSFQHYYFFNMISGVLIVVSLLKSDCISFLVNNRVSVWLGKVSFSAYLIQMPVFYVVTTRVFYYLKSQGHSYAFNAVMAALITFVAVYLLAYIFWWAIDARSIALSKYGLLIKDDSAQKISASGSQLN
ncbi:hypothetical protein SP99_01076 [Enterobacter sp. BIDMC92]|uniref:acyltransferase family protein n=1 Tax=Enterobacter sp. BIDMC92 TaxID=1594172 RepID=UPI00065934CF|nr:acyltransferase [Enterobacter sp. BIDMC92]KLW90874.1 hypothetical protein SP99_01076 [Enterobacter sp. BIDMC92]